MFQTLKRATPVPLTDAEGQPLESATSYALYHTSAGLWRIEGSGLSPDAEQATRYSGQQLANSASAWLENFEAVADSSGEGQITESTVLIHPNSISPLHAATDKNKLETLTQSMRAGGYQGRPILLLDRGKGKYQALTGSHRIVAARRAGIRIPSLVVHHSRLSHHALDPDFLKSTDDHDKEYKLRRHGVTDAADLMKQELIESTSNDSPIRITETSKLTKQPPDHYRQTVGRCPPGYQWDADKKHCVPAKASGVGEHVKRAEFISQKGQTRGGPTLRLPENKDNKPATPAGVNVKKKGAKPEDEEEEQAQVEGGLSQQARAVGTAMGDARHETMGKFLGSDSPKTAMQQSASSFIGQETREMMSMCHTLEKILAGELVTPEEQDACVRQAADIVKSSIFHAIAGEEVEDQEEMELAQAVSELLYSHPENPTWIVDRPIQQAARVVFVKRYGKSLNSGDDAEEVPELSDSDEDGREEAVEFIHAVIDYLVKNPPSAWSGGQEGAEESINEVRIVPRAVLHNPSKGELQAFFDSEGSRGIDHHFGEGPVRGIITPTGEHYWGSAYHHTHDSLMRAVGVPNSDNSRKGITRPKSLTVMHDGSIQALRIDPKKGYSRHWADFEVPGVGSKLEPAIDTRHFGESSFMSTGVTPYQRAKDTARALNDIDGVEGVWFSPLDGTLKVKAGNESQDQVQEMVKRAGMSVELVDAIDPLWRSLTNEQLQEWSDSPDFTIEEIQLYFDMQITAGENVRSSLERTRKKFSVDSLQVSPMGRISSPNIAIPSAQQQQADAAAQAQQQQAQDQMDMDLQQKKAEAQIEASAQKNKR